MSHLESLRRIQSVADAALAHLELDPLLDELTLRVKEALETDTVAFLLLDEETNELVARAARGIEEEVVAGVRIPVGAGFAGRIAAEKRALVIDDVDHSDVLNPILREKGIKSLLGAPLLVGGRVLGVLHVGTLTHRAFTDDDAALLQLTADRAALAIDHGRAYEAERALAERYTRLQSVTDAALTYLDTDELLDELVLRVREILRADTCAILLLDESRAELLARAAAGLEEEVEAGVRIPVGGGFAGRVAAEARPVFLPDVDHAHVLNPILREKGIKTLLGAPLLARGRVLGVIHVGWLSLHPESREELELLQTAAERAALGLERALLHDQLLELDAVRNRFVATASHELRTPTTVIMGSVLTLEARRDELSAEQEEQLIELLATQTRRLAALVEQLLDVSRLEHRGVQLQRERRRVRELVEHTLAGLEPSQRDAVTLDVDEALEIDTDPAAFERIVVNLVVNAFRHGAPPVVVSAGARGEGVELVVEDGGGGVPDDVRERLFEQFTRSRRSTDTVGSGLGLAIARSYAQAQGGDVVLDANGARGARFRVYLPGPAAPASG